MENEGQLDSWLQALAPDQPLALSVQGDSEDTQCARLLGIALATSPEQAGYLPLAGASAAGAQPASALEKLKPLLEDPARPKLGHDLRYDSRLLSRHGVVLAGDCHDTMLESHVVNNVHAACHDLDALVAIWLDREALGYQTLGNHQEASEGRGVAVTARRTFVHLRYRELDEQADHAAWLHDTHCAAAEQAQVIPSLHQALYRELADDPSLQALYREVEQPLLHILVQMEARGVLVDADSAEQQIGREMQDLEQQAQALRGQPLDMTSPAQLRTALFEELQLPVIKKTPGGKPSTDEAVLQTLASKGHALPGKVLEYRRLKNLRVALARLAGRISADTGRVHACYCQAMGDSGRLDIDPGMKKDTPGIRRACTSPPGRRLLTASYAQLRERLVAHLSADPLLLEAFASGGDVHRHIAAALFEVADEAVSAEQLRAVKGIIFKPIYGGTAHERLSGLRGYLRGLSAGARDRGYVETLFHRRLYLPDLQARDPARRRRAEQDVGRWSIEGNAADIIRRAMIAIDAWLADTHKDVVMVLQIDAGLIFEVGEADSDVARQGIGERMTGVIALRPPLKVDMVWGSQPE